MYLARFSGFTSAKNTCRFFKAFTLTSLLLSLRNLSRMVTKSLSVISGPKIFANSWMDAASVFFV